jgi:hypothetical protein
LRDAVQDHRDLHRQGDRVHAHQDHAARHAEHGGDHRRRERDERDQRGQTFHRSLRGPEYRLALTKRKENTIHEIESDQESFMIDQIEALAALAEHGTMRSAATRLRISQSAVTKRIDALEAQLGVRCASACRATCVPDAGRESAARARAAVARGAAAAVAGERSVAGGWLVVGVSESILASWGPRARGRAAAAAGSAVPAERASQPVAVDLVRRVIHARAGRRADARRSSSPARRSSRRRW